MTQKPLSILMVAWLTSIGLISCGPNLELQRRKAAAIRDAGVEYLAAGRYPEALKRLREAEKLDPKGDQIKNDLGYTYLNMGQTQEAVTIFQEALALNPRFSEARNNLGTAYLEEGDLDAAVACFQNVTKDLEYPTPHYPLTNLGRAFYLKKEYHQAERYYLEALKIAPDFVKALHGLGLTYLAMGEEHKAVETLERAVRDAPKVPQIYLDLAAGYERIGSSAKALETYHKAIEIDPGSDTAAKAQDAIERLKAENRG